MDPRARMGSGLSGRDRKLDLSPEGAAGQARTDSRLPVPCLPTPPPPGVSPVLSRPADPATNPDAPVRIEVEMPHGLYDRLTGHDEAPRCRYDTATGRAEFVAEPGAAHERRAAEISALFGLIRSMLGESGRVSGFQSMAATRLISDDGAFEPDASLFIDRSPEDMELLMQIDGYLHAGRGHPMPDLVVEIDRSVVSSYKLAPYFRMGVREAWTWNRDHGARIWIAESEAPSGFRAADHSRVLPGIEQEGLDRLLARTWPAEASRQSHRLASAVVRAVNPPGSQGRVGGDSKI